MLGYDIATNQASVLGIPPNTTYSEATGTVTLTRSFNPRIMTRTAMGAIMLILLGTILVVGVNTLVRAQLDFLYPRNIAIVAIICVFALRK